ncbi:hypothetical protein B0T26DRAFT_636707, partial [Lasiosphaeria miniovina]
KQTYNTRDSLVVTDPTTSLALIGLSMGERTGSRIFQWVWSYVTVMGSKRCYLGSFLLLRGNAGQRLVRVRAHDPRGLSEIRI